MKGKKAGGLRKKKNQHGAKTEDYRDRGKKNTRRLSGTEEGVPRPGKSSLLSSSHTRCTDEGDGSLALG